MDKGFDDADTASHVEQPTARVQRKRVPEPREAKQSTIRKRRGGDPSEEPSWIRAIRERSGISQRAFWPIFGASQGAGCRYESETRQIPMAVQMLLVGFDKGLINRGLLIDLKAKVQEAKKERTEEDKSCEE